MLSNDTNTGIIILNWNNSKLTIRMLNQLKRIGKNYILMVIDNNSDEYNRELLIKEFEESNWNIIKEDSINFHGTDVDSKIKTINLILLNKNYGYSKGNNIGIRLLHSIKCKYSLILNSDIIIPTSFSEDLSYIINIMEADPKIAIAAPKIVDCNGVQQGPYKRPSAIMDSIYYAFYPLSYLIKRIIIPLKHKKADGKITFPYASIGCFWVVNNEKFKEIGYFDEDFFLYSEEFVIGEKLMLHGYKFAYIPYKTFIHISEATTSKYLRKKRFKMKLDSLLLYYYKYRNISAIEKFLLNISFKIFKMLWLPILPNEIPFSRKRVIKFLKREEEV